MAKNSLMQRAAAGLEFPGDVVTGIPRIDLLGQEHLRVMNHCGICLYDSERIILRLRDSMLEICGHELVMSVLDEEKLTVDGYIASLRFTEDGDEK